MLVSRGQPGNMHNATVLIAAPNASERGAIADALAAEGHFVLTADNGKRALQTFAAEAVDVAVLACPLALIDGFEVARAMRASAPQVPLLLLLTPPVEATFLQAMAHGASDFLTRPVSWPALSAKVAALVRMRRELAAVTERLTRIEAEYDELKHEVEAAERLFGRFAQAAMAPAGNLRHFSRPKALANGDLVAAAVGPDGVQRALIGDFSGHGLSAAIATLCASEVFHAGVRGARRAGEIACTLNAQLRATLPIGRFLAAAIVALEPLSGRLEVCNAGMPDVLVYRPGHGVVARGPSCATPLGIAPAALFESQSFALEPGDRVYLCSDGLLETVDWSGTAFGEERLVQCLAHSGGGSAVDLIEQALARFRAGRPQRDDMTLVEITYEGSAG